ncbi:hypothetical protein SAMN05192574_11665 [Mucilaginibacter gossypiicola]|uniref:Uncharacterized protein n=1 Tax=Mucilaginibacter gossypiicola TaxID=551995 RepID=A0A1H8TNA6_9SPHI|nr:hypothetical protein [Mucilaginibacter gossypiicola]SEO92316.1 hypothetical protein SAMN05192574_11665 [Mucilaginibacter gossypiicola]
MKPKQIVIELLIVVTTIATTWLTLKLLTNKTIIDVQLHDSYFIMAPSTLILPISSLLLTLIYLIKEGLAGYKRRFQNLILVTSNFLLLVWLYPLSIFIKNLPQPGWTVPPSLSALPKATPDIESRLKDYSLIVKNVKLYTPVVVIVFMLILVAATFVTGKNWNAKPHEQNSN